MAKQESLTGKIDWITVIIYVILSVLGWLMIHSASTGGETVSVFDTNINSGKQFQWMIASFILAFVILIVDSRFYTTFAYVFYVLLILFVVAVMAVGTSVKGQQNWIRIGGFQMQPSELAKFGAALGLSKFLSGLNVDIRKWKDKWKAFAIIGIPMVIVMVQGDAGSAIVFVAFALVLFRDGLESYYLITGATVTVLAVLALLVNTYWLAGSLTFLAGVIIYFRGATSKP
jgi:rod shape determining protein RodA